MASPLLRFINAHHVLNTMVRIIPRRARAMSPPTRTMAHRRPPPLAPIFHPLTPPRLPLDARS